MDWMDILERIEGGEESKLQCSREAWAWMRPDQ